MTTPDPDFTPGEVAYARTLSPALRLVTILRFGGAVHRDTGETCYEVKLPTGHTTFLAPSELVHMT